jgi:hypothetical protein
VVLVHNFPDNCNNSNNLRNNKDKLMNIILCLFALISCGSNNFHTRENSTLYLISLNKDPEIRWILNHKFPDPEINWRAHEAREKYFVLDISYWKKYPPLKNCDGRNNELWKKYFNSLYGYYINGDEVSIWNHFSEEGADRVTTAAWLHERMEAGLTKEKAQAILDRGGVNEALNIYYAPKYGMYDIAFTEIRNEVNNRFITFATAVKGMFK